MDYRENAGYVITDSCHVGDSEFVLGVHLTAPQQFVTWKCSNRTDYDWGHYFSDLFSAQHGGVMVRRELAEKVFRKEAMGCGFIASGYLCFEEDNDAQVALRELMDKKMIQAPVNGRFAPGAYEAVINSSVQIHHPEYWQAREKAISEQNRQAKKKGRER